MVGLTQKFLKAALTTRGGAIVTSLTVATVLSASLGVFGNNAYDNDKVFDLNIQDKSGDRVLIVADIDKPSRLDEFLGGDNGGNSVYTNIRYETVNSDDYRECNDSNNCVDFVGHVQGANYNANNIEPYLTDLRKKLGEAIKIGSGLTGNVSEYCGSKHRGQSGMNLGGNEGIDKISAKIKEEISQTSLQSSENIHALVKKTVGLLLVNDVADEAIHKFQKDISGTQENKATFSLSATCSS